MSSSEYEVVHTVTDYWDGPRVGIANFNGKPHYYKCIFDELSDDWSSVFLLHPIAEEIFQLCLEDWSIWKRWIAAFEAGQASDATHPALPEDRVRHEELSAVLALYMKPDAEKDFRVEGKFEIVERRVENRSLEEWRVKWRKVP